MLNLVAIFDSLKPPDTSTGTPARFSAQPIPDYEQHRLGKSMHGMPSLLISVRDPLAAERPAPIILEHLNVQYDIDCRISLPDGHIEADQFTIVSCTVLDKALHIYFLRVIGTIVVSLGPTPSRLDVARAIDTLVELFRTLTEKPRKSIQGLWAELFLIARTRETAKMVDAWHVTPEDRYDFSAGSQRIEVKSTSGRVRQHHFTLEQLCPPANTQVLVASMFVEYAGAGTSLGELAEKVRSRISETPSLLLHLDQIISATLGENWRDALEDRFDSELAEDTLAFFEVSTIPAVNRDIPFGVSNVHFKSDLSGCPPINVPQFRALGGLFQAALQRSSRVLKK
jgi:hypothetical protein